jgi:hypothetical protein
MVPIDKLKEIEIKPAFLSQALANIPRETSHLVMKDVEEVKF